MTFAELGWARGQWHDLHAFFSGHDQGPSGRAVANWLCHPPDFFITPITAAQVRDLYTRHGDQTCQVLNAVAAGASERFCDAYLNPAGGVVDDQYDADVAGGWANALSLGLSEPQAVGWAAAGYLRAKFAYVLVRNGIDLDEATAMIRIWTSQFGPTAYLYVLAGVGWAAAGYLRDHHTSPTDERLRVMAALKGATLPDGI